MQFSIGLLLNLKPQDFSPNNNEKTYETCKWISNAWKESNTLFFGLVGFCDLDQSFDEDDHQFTFGFCFLLGISFVHLETQEAKHSNIHLWSKILSFSCLKPFGEDDSFNNVKSQNCSIQFFHSNQSATFTLHIVIIQEWTKYF